MCIEHIYLIVFALWLVIFTENWDEWTRGDQESSGQGDDQYNKDEDWGEEEEPYYDDPNFNVSWKSQGCIVGCPAFKVLTPSSTYFQFYHLYVLFVEISYQARFYLQISYSSILFTMLIGFLNRGSFIIYILLLGMSKLFTFSVFCWVHAFTSLLPGTWRRRAHQWIWTKCCHANDTRRKHLSKKSPTLVFYAPNIRRDFKVLSIVGGMLETFARNFKLFSRAT